MAVPPGVRGRRCSRKCQKLPPSSQEMYWYRRCTGAADAPSRGENIDASRRAKRCILHRTSNCLLLARPWLPVWHSRYDNTIGGHAGKQCFWSGCFSTLTARCSASAFPVAPPQGENYANPPAASCRKDAQCNGNANGRAPRASHWEAARK